VTTVRDVESLRAHFALMLRASGPRTCNAGGDFLPGSAHVRGRPMIEQLLFDRRTGRTRTRCTVGRRSSRGLDPGFQVAGVAPDVRPLRGEQARPRDAHQDVSWPAISARPRVAYILDLRSTRSHWCRSGDVLCDLQVIDPCRGARPRRSGGGATRSR
jgi:hypothetical protein